MSRLLADDAESRLVNVTGTADLTVTDDDTAIAMGSGDIRVFATPRMIALMEQAACEALSGQVPAGVTTVGVRVDVRHVAASPVGAVVTASARVTGVDGDRISFEVTATHLQGTLPVVIGTGTHLRVAVDAAAFVAGLDAKR
jgi:fluoroacetyl-CoA thioesterase